MAKRKPPEPPRSPSAAPPAQGGPMIAPPDTRPAHRRAADGLAAALAGAPPAAARDALAALLARSTDTPRRAARAALIDAIRQASGPARPALPAAAPAPDPEPEAPPPPRPAPAPKAGALTSLALEDAARLLFAAGGDDDDATGPALPDDGTAATDPAGHSADDPAPPAFQKLDLSAFDAFGDSDSDTAQPPPPPAHDPKPGRRKAKATDPAQAAAMLAGDAADAEVTPAPKPAAFDLSAQFAAMDAPDEA